MPARPLVRCAIYTRARPGQDHATSSCVLQREACRAFVAAVIVPEEAEIVRGMFDAAAGGMLPATIATRANEKRLVDKNGKTGGWSAKAVLRILRNATYAGRLRDVIDRALFRRVGESIASRQTRAPTPRPLPEGTFDPFILRDLLVCARCGKRMTTSSRGKVDEQTRDGERSKLTVIADEVGIANGVESWRRIHARGRAGRTHLTDVRRPRADRAVHARRALRRACTRR